VELKLTHRRSAFSRERYLSLFSSHGNSRRSSHEMSAGFRRGKSTTGIERERGRGKEERRNSSRIRQNDETRARAHSFYTRVWYHARLGRSRGRGRVKGGWEGGGRGTCTATQQFRVKCYVSESVMPMWAEANLWGPVSARTRVRTCVRARASARVYVRVHETHRMQVYR